MDRKSFGADTLSDANEDLRDERNRDRYRKVKREKGYAQLSRASSEEELVINKSPVKPKKGGKVFGKLQGKQKEKDKRRSQQCTPSPNVKKRDYREKEPVKGKKLDFRTNRPILGVSLQQAFNNNKSHDGVPIPVAVRQCIEYVEDNALSLEGIYRISAPKTQLEELKTAAYSGQSLNFVDGHCAAGFLKSFLRELPEHILTDEFYPQFEKEAAECPCRTEYCTCLTGDKIKALLTKLPPWNYFLLAYLFRHMKKIMEHEEMNKMALPSVGSVLQPTLKMSQRLLTIFLRNTVTRQKEATSLFEDVEVKRYVSPLRPAPDRLSQELPSKRKDVEEELEKQQSLLADLHDEVHALREKGMTSPTKEQELWEVQMVATQLKRKLKVIRQKENHQTSPKEDDRVSQDEEHGPCVEMFEEKQLLAVQMELKERICAERKAIRLLEDEIAAVQNEKITAEEVHYVCMEDDKSEEDWRAQYTELINKRNFILAEITMERQRCARLRAEIELMTIQKQQKPETSRL